MNHNSDVDTTSDTTSDTALQQHQENWQQVKPPHRWEAHGRTIQCTLCRLTVHPEVEPRIRPRPCITTHLIDQQQTEARALRDEAVSQARRACLLDQDEDDEPRRRYSVAVCGHTAEWRTHFPFFFMEGPLLLPSLTTTLFRGVPPTNKEQPDARKRIQVNCPDCLQPGQQERTEQ